MITQKITVRSKDDEEESDTEPDQHPEPLLIKSMSEALKWATQLKLFNIEKNQAKLVDEAAEMEHDTTDLIVKGHQKKNSVLHVLMTFLN